MSCENVQELISLYLDGGLPSGQRESVLAHAGACRNCGERLEAMQTQRVLLREMSHAAVPASLAARLQVIASHDRDRRLATVSLGARLRRVVGDAKLTFDNMMRPVALPFTGGLLSTLLIFGFLMPTLSFSHPNYDSYEFRTLPRGEIVTNPWDQGAAADGEDFPFFADPAGPEDADFVNVVNLTIDQNGRVEDWHIVRGRLTDEIRDIIQFGKFVPATTLGLNTSGVIQVRQSLTPCKFRRCTNSNSVTVRG